MSTEVANETRLIKGIPINNLWILMFWASDLYPHLINKKISTEENLDDNLADLIAEILCGQKESRARRQSSIV